MASQHYWRACSHSGPALTSEYMRDVSAHAFTCAEWPLKLRMSLFVCVRECPVCVCVCVRARARARAHACMHACVCAGVIVRVRLCVGARVRMLACACVLAHVQVRKMAAKAAFACVDAGERVCA